MRLSHPLEDYFNLFHLACTGSHQLQVKRVKNSESLICQLLAPQPVHMSAEILYSVTKKENLSHRLTHLTESSAPSAPPRSQSTQRERLEAWVNYAFRTLPWDML
jgi:hypothetical protein